MTAKKKKKMKKETTGGIPLDGRQCSVWPLMDDVTQFSKRVMSGNEEACEKTLKGLCDVYKWLKSVEGLAKGDRSLEALAVQGFDQEQIWQQLDLHNRPVLARLAHFSKANFGSATVPGRLQSDDNGVESDDNDVDAFLDNGEQMASSSDEGGADEVVPDGDGDEEDEDEADEDEEDEDEEGTSDGADDRQRQLERVTERGRKSAVDDQFFSLAEMETFLEQEDRKAMRGDRPADDDHLLDFDEDIGSGTTIANYRYEDYFGPRNAISVGSKKSVRFEKEEGKDDDEEEDGEGVSEEGDEGWEKEEEEGRMLFGDHDDTPATGFQQRQDRLREKIKTLEDENLEPKKWQMGGEASGESRDKHELLQEHLAFEHATKTTPIVTQETTEKLEHLIAQRIKDMAFDDVERKVKPKEGPKKYRNELVLDQEKSKQSLAEVYENEYLKQNQKVEVEQKNVKHEEIKSLMRQLFTKLDALSNFHFAPKEVTSEIRVVNNMRSLVVEEVGPTVTSDAALLAPEEVKDHAKGQVKARDELTTTDRARERRHKKTVAKIKGDRKRKREKEIGVSGDGMADLRKVARVKKSKDGQTGGKVKSASFFSQLQAEVTRQTATKRQKIVPSTTDHAKTGANYKL